MYGECKYGESCAFAQGDSELKQKKLSFNYKTKPCKQFFESGYCSYGSRCQFSHKKDNLTKQSNDEVSYLKIMEELLSEDKKISHELVKRPRLMTFENITHCTLEESEHSKLKLYEDIINLKDEKSKKNENNKKKIILNFQMILILILFQLLQAMKQMIKKIRTFLIIIINSILVNYYEI